MLCKKCNTAVDENDKFCKSCGAKINGKNSGTIKIVGICVILLLIAVCGIYIWLSQTGRINFGEDSKKPPVETTVPGAAASESPAPSAPATENPDSNSDLQAIWPMLEEIYKGAAQYVEDYEGYTPFISDKGYLYDMAASTYVTVTDLIDSSKIADKYKNETVSLLYVRPSDFSGFSEVTFSNSTDLAIFVSIETKTGVALYSPNDSGVCYRENLNKVLESYNPEHGEIKRPVSTIPGYIGIVEAIKSFEFHEEDYDVRYMAYDDKYAFAAVSKINESSVLYNYVLEANNGGYNVLGTGFETARHPAVEINKLAPDFNLGLMPKYNIGKTALVDPVQYQYIPDSLKNEKQISDTDFPVTFISGTSDCLYITFQSGKHYLGIYEAPQGWKLFPVEDWFEAEITLTAKMAEPATYILKQE